MIQVNRTSAAITIDRNTLRLAVLCSRYLAPLIIARTPAIVAVQRYSAPFALIRLPHFPELQSGLMGADGSFLQGAGGALLQGADA